LKGSRENDTPPACFLLTRVELVSPIHKSNHQFLDALEFAVSRFSVRRNSRVISQIKSEERVAISSVFAEGMSSSSKFTNGRGSVWQFENR
jgi:hypothetical protein